jgi:tagatose-6-phosphate ketose/aldose isomerase
MSRATDALHSLLDRPIEYQEAAGYFHTVREIASQPVVWRATADVVTSSFGGLRTFLGGASRLLFTGAGSSYYAALAAASALRSCFDVVEAIPSTEIVTDPEGSLPREPFVLVSLARSGDSPESMAVVELAEALRPREVRHLAVTCNRDGALARSVGALGNRGFALLLPAETNDRGLAMTSSVTSMTIAGYGLAFLASPGSYGSVVKGLAEAAVQILGRGSDLAARLAETAHPRAFFLASRPFVAGAHEAHLKVQEMSGGKVIAKAEDTLGFRHGFMAAVDTESLIVLHLSGHNYRRKYELDLLAELQAKGLGRTTVVFADRAEGAHGEVLEYGERPAVSDEYRAPLAMLPGQLLGLFVSLRLGLKPDNPSPAGVINRVVQGVRIHPYRGS